MAGGAHASRRRLPDKRHRAQGVGQASRELLEGIEVYRHPALPEGNALFGYAIEYAAALFWEMVLAWRIFLRTGFDVVHVSNPPDTLFMVGGLFKLLFGRRLVFDHHDICPELYEAESAIAGCVPSALLAGKMVDQDSRFSHLDQRILTAGSPSGGAAKSLRVWWWCAMDPILTACGGCRRCRH